MLCPRAGMHMRHALPPTPDARRRRRRIRWTLGSGHLKVVGVAVVVDDDGDWPRDVVATLDALALQPRLKAVLRLLHHEHANQLLDRLDARVVQLGLCGVADLRHHAEVVELRVVDVDGEERVDVPRQIDERLWPLSLRNGTSNNEW